MLDLICVSSVLIVCSSLHFTWEEGRKEKQAFSGPQSSRGAHLTLLPGPSHLPEQVKKLNWKPHARNTLLASLGSAYGGAHTSLRGVSELVCAGRSRGEWRAGNPAGLAGAWWAGEEPGALHGAAMRPPPLLALATLPPALALAGKAGGGCGWLYTPKKALVSAVQAHCGG